MGVALFLLIALIVIAVVSQAKMRVKVLAGDWGSNKNALVKLSPLVRNPKSISLPSGLLKRETITSEQLAELTQITEENKNSFLGKTAAGIAGGIVFGAAA